MIDELRQSGVTELFLYSSASKKFVNSGNQSVVENKKCDSGMTATINITLELWDAINLLVNFRWVWTSEILKVMWQHNFGLA